MKLNLTVGLNLQFVDSLRAGSLIVSMGKRERASEPAKLGGGENEARKSPILPLALPAPSPFCIFLCLQQVSQFAGQFVD